MAEAAAIRWRRRRNWPLWLGATLLGFYALVAAIGPLLPGIDANGQDLLAVLEPPSREHWLGTDNIGRDLFARIVVGTRFTLAAALLAVGIAGVIGVTLGLVAGYSGGRIDAAITGAVDLLLTIPNLILAIAIASVIGAGMTGLVVATTASFVPPLARLIRGRVLEIREEDFIKAAIASGTVIGVVERRPVNVPRRMSPSASRPSSASSTAPVPSPSSAASAPAVRGPLPSRCAATMKSSTVSMALKSCVTSARCWTRHAPSLPPRISPTQVVM